MMCCSLNSGSNGNCIYVEAGGARLLFDAGISGKQAAERLELAGRNIRSVSAVIVSHDHADHVRSAGVFARKFKLPVYMTRRTYQAAGRYALGPIADLRFFRPGQPLAIDGASIEPHATPHDAHEPVAFVVAAEGRRLGVFTDLGRVFTGLGELLAGLDAMYLESNYDPDMLETGPYPTFLKRRIAGGGGHLSNFQAAELVRSLPAGRLQWVSLAHLSEANNTPQLALRTHVGIAGRRRPVHVASRYRVSELLTVE